MLDIWRPYRDEKGWILWWGELNMAELDGKWEGTEEVNKPKLVIGFLCLRGEILVMGGLKNYKVPP